MPILRCKVIHNEVGVKQFIPTALDDNGKLTTINDRVVAFNVFPDGQKVDMRARPPFYNIIPCPYCGTDNGCFRGTIPGASAPRYSRIFSQDNQTVSGYAGVSYGTIPRLQGDFLMALSVTNKNVG